MIPPAMKTKLLARFDDLITRVTNAKNSPGFTSMADLREARSSMLTLLENVIPHDSAHRRFVGQVNDVWPNEDVMLSKLRAVREDLELGMFDNLAERIAGAIAVNYLEQAEQLLGEGAGVTHGHVPAAVLAGAVLERHLRELCAKQTPPIDTVKANGEPKTLDPLITDLARVSAISQTKAAVLRGWAAIRNKAAHGEWDKFSRGDVETMVKGVTQFIAGL
jgi:hypothetical protein